MKIEQRDLVLIPIPFTDLSSNRKRPVIVISCQEYNESTEDIIVVGVTSNIKDKTPYSFVISNDNMEDGKIKMESRVRADKIYTLAKSIVVKKFGKVNEKTHNKITTLLQKVVGHQALNEDENEDQDPTC